MGRYALDSLRSAQGDLPFGMKNEQLLSNLPHRRPNHDNDAAKNRAWKQIFSSSAAESPGFAPPWTSAE